MTKTDLKLWKEYKKWVAKRNESLFKRAKEIMTEANKVEREFLDKQFEPYDKWEKLPFWKQFFVPLPTHQLQHSAGAEMQKVLASAYMEAMVTPTQEGFMDWLVKREKI